MSADLGAFLVRDLRVWASDCEVVRHVWGKLHPRRRRSRRLRYRRKVLYRQALAAHRESRELYYRVQAGQFRTVGKRSRKP